VAFILCWYYCALRQYVRVAGRLKATDGKMMAYCEAVHYVIKTGYMCSHSHFCKWHQQSCQLTQRQKLIFGCLSLNCIALEILKVIFEEIK